MGTRVMYLKGGCLNNLPLKGTSRVMFVFCLCSHEQYNPKSSGCAACGTLPVFPISHLLVELFIGRNNS